MQFATRTQVETAHSNQICAHQILCSLLRTLHAPTVHRTLQQSTLLQYCPLRWSWTSKFNTSSTASFLRLSHFTEIRLRACAKLRDIKGSGLHALAFRRSRKLLRRMSTGSCTAAFRGAGTPYLVLCYAGAITHHHNRLTSTTQMRGS